MSVMMEDGKAGKQVPSILNLQGREFEEKPEAKEDLDSAAEVVEEPQKPAENGHPLPAVDVLGVGKQDTHDGVPNSVPYGDESEIKMDEPPKLDVQQANVPRLDLESSSLMHLFLLDANGEGSDSGTKKEQSLFMKELEKFFREKNMEFKPPKLKGKGVNCLKLWRAVMNRGGYDKVTSGKLWGQVGKSFRPPKTCNTVSWTFRGFYEKALLDFEREKLCAGELNIPAPSTGEPTGNESQASVSGRTPRDAATRARLRWHSRCSLGNGEVGIPIVKEKRASAAQKRENRLESNGSRKRKNQSEEGAVATIQPEASESRLDAAMVDVGFPADEAKKDEQKTKDCSEIYALVPGILPEFASTAQLKEAVEKALAVLQTQEQTLSMDTLDMLSPHLKVLMSSSAPIALALSCKRFEMVMTDQLGTFVEAKRRKIALEEEIESTRESLESPSLESLARSSLARKRLAGLEDRKHELEREIAFLSSERDRVEEEIEEARDELRVISDFAAKERDRSAARERLIKEMALAEMSTCQGDVALSSLKTMLIDAASMFGDS